MTGQNILVVGGAAGIGKKIVEDLAEHGGHVAVADLNVEAGQSLVNELREQGKKATFYSIDVCSWSDCKRMADEMTEELGSIDALVHSAGITSRLSFDQVDWDVWKRTVNVNLTGLFNVAKAVAPSMIEKQSGSIVIIGSGSAISGTGGGVHYAASKGGAFGFMRTLAKELGTYGINVNVVAPRVIRSEMLDSLYPTEGEQEALVRQIPIGRLGTTSDVSHMVRFLCSHEAGYVHGQVLVLDGGRTFVETDD